MKLANPLLLPLLLAAFALLSTHARADNEYRALMTGCTKCNNCKKKVVMSFAEIEGVESVRFLKEMKNDLYQVIVVTKDGSTISEQRARETLKPLPHYELKAWQIRIN
jgi:hypothetical protein